MNGFELVCVNKAAFAERIKRWSLSPPSGQCPVNIHGFNFISIEIGLLSESTVTLQMRKTNTYQHVSSSTSVHRNHRGSQHDPNLLIITLRRLKPVGTAESPTACGLMAQTWRTRRQWQQTFCCTSTSKSPKIQDVPQSCEYTKPSEKNTAAILKVYLISVKPHVQFIQLLL